jgi:hypothetical protein
MRPTGTIPNIPGRVLHLSRHAQILHRVDGGIWPRLRDVPSVLGAEVGEEVSVGLNKVRSSMNCPRLGMEVLSFATREKACSLVSISRRNQYCRIVTPAWGSAFTLRTN